MLFFGLRLNLMAIPRIIATIIGLYELCIILRYVLRFFLPQDGRVITALTVITEPVVGRVRALLTRLFGTFSIDFSPAVSILLLEILGWLVGIIF